MHIDYEERKRRRGVVLIVEIHRCDVERCLAFFTLLLEAFERHMNQLIA